MGGALAQVSTSTSRPLLGTCSSEAAPGGVMHPCPGGRGTCESAGGCSGSEFLNWVFRPLCEFDPLCPVSSRKLSFITAQPTLGFLFLSLLWPLEQGNKPSAYRGQAGNEWSRLRVMQQGVVGTGDAEAQGSSSAK